MPTSDSAPTPNEGARDLRRSILLGPVRSLTPALLNVALMPVVVARGGLEAVGFWATLNLAVGACLILDLGVSQYVSKGFSTRSLDHALLLKALDTVLSIWLLIAVGLAIMSLAFAQWAYALLGLTHHDLATTLALPLLPLIGACALAANLFAFLHVSALQNHYAQINQVVAAVVQFVVGISLLYLIAPLPALALAFTAGYGYRAAALYLNLRRIRFIERPCRFVWPRPSIVRTVFHPARGFALLGAAQQLFHVANRAGVLIFGGATALGAFEIASRIPFLLEQIFSNGLQPLFAVFARANWRTDGDKGEMHKLVRWTYELLVATSVAALAAWIALAGPVIGIWLNLSDPDILRATQVLALFNVFRVLNVPTFWMLQARGLELWAGAIYMAQAVATIPTAVLVRTFHAVDFLTFSFIVCALGIATELAVLLGTQLRLKFIAATGITRRDLAPFLCAFVLVAAAWQISAPPALRVAAFGAGLPDALACALLWGGAVLLLSGGRPQRLLRHSR